MARLPRFLITLNRPLSVNHFQGKTHSGTHPHCGALPTSGSAPLLLMTYNKTIGRDDMLVV